MKTRSIRSPGTAFAVLAGVSLLLASSAVRTTATAAEGDAPTESIGWRASAKAPDTVEARKDAIVPVAIQVLPGHYIYRERTRFALDAETTGDVATLGAIDWPKTTTHFDKFQNKDVEIYDEGSHEFPVHLTASKPGSYELTLQVKSQACTKEFCLFPHTELVKLSLRVSAAAGAAATPAHTPKPTPTAKAAASATATQAAAVPSATATHAAAVVAATPSAAPSPVATTFAATTDPASDATPSLWAALSDENAMAKVIGTHFFLALLFAFVGGIGMSFTPCVYPMIPITVSIIGAEAQARKSRGFALSLVYVAGICVVYSVLGVIAAASGKEFGFLLASPYVRLGIAAIFLALAASMFGAFHLELPSSFVTKMHQYRGTGLIGVFVTGLFAGIVAGPCTAPVLLGILIAISTGIVGAAAGFGLMMALSLGLGLLFIVIGTSSGALSALPRSGPWMERVKHVFGFLLIGAALYYLRVTVPGWVFSGLLGLTLVFAGIHFGAFAKLEEHPPELLRAGKAAGMAFVASGLYFVVAATAASGVGPQVFPTLPTIASNGGSSARHDAQIAWITDEPTAKAQAASAAKPMFIDFWGDTCEDCKALDATVYVDPRVVAAAKDFVPVKIDTSINFDTPAAREKEIDALRKRYDILGLPRVVFLRPDGTVIQGLAVTGLVTPETFLDRMHKALEETKGCDATRVSC